MKTKPTPPPATGQDRKALHAYVSDEAHEAWHEAAAEILLVALEQIGNGHWSSPAKS